jgi:hypothetical protein
LAAFDKPPVAKAKFLLTISDISVSYLVIYLTSYPKSFPFRRSEIPLRKPFICNSFKTLDSKRLKALCFPHLRENAGGDNPERKRLHVAGDSLALSAHTALAAPARLAWVPSGKMLSYA